MTYEKLPTIKGKDYSWGAESVAPKPKPRPAVVARPKAPVQAIAVKATIDRIFEASGDERGAEIRKLALYCPPGFFWTNSNTNALVVSLGKLIDNLDPNGTEEVKGMLKAVLTRSGVNGASLNAVSNMCTNQIMRNREKADEQVSALDVYYSFTDRNARWKALGGMPIERIIIRPRAPAGGYVAPKAEEITPVTVVPQLIEAKPAMIKISEEPAKELADVMEHVQKMHNSLVGKIGEEGTGRATAAYGRLGDAYEELYNYLKKGEAINVQNLNRMLSSFLSRLNNYSIASATDYNAYRITHKKSWVEGTMDWAIPVGTGIAALIELRKGRKEGIKGLKNTAAELKKISALKTEAKLLEKGIAGYTKLGKKELGPIYQWLVRTGIGTGAVVGGGLVGGGIEYSMDSLFRSMTKGEIRQFFFNQNKIINDMRNDLTALQKQNTTDNQALATQIDVAWANLQGTQETMRAAEAAINRGQKAPDFMADFWKSATAVAVISITLPWVLAAGGTGLKAVSKRMREIEKAKAAEAKKLARKTKK
jgi:hypothetical protein